MHKPSQPISLQRWWDSLAAFLLIAALLIAATRLVSTHWTRDLGIIQNIAFIAGGFGLALGQSRFSSRAAALLATIYGLFVIPWQLGLTLPEGIAWRERIFILADRLGNTVTLIFEQEAITDNIFFITSMALLFWVLSIHAGFNLTRHAHVWRLIIPAGVTLFIVHFFANCPFPFDAAFFCDNSLSVGDYFIPVYLLVALMLVWRLNYLKQNRQWQEQGIAITADTSYDLMRYAAVAIVLIVLAAWVAPASARALPSTKALNDLMAKPFQALRDRFDYLFASLTPSSGVISDYYSENLSLGTGAVLSETPIMLVETPGQSDPGFRYYWRARVYDEYRGGHWLSNANRTLGTRPDQFELSPPLGSSRRIETLTFIPYRALTTLFSAAEPLWVSRPASIQAYPAGEGDIEIAAINASPYLKAYEPYQVRASLSTVTISQLKAAGSDYPDFIVERYLQLPETITPRMRQLALQITAGAETPYDKAQAITNYLRANITYRKTIPAAPRGREPLDWFLFEYKQGFCNYYASADAVLLRSLGIPARVAAGYLSGELQEASAEKTTAYLVRQRDAHAWTEVYFPGIGWVEFEPTASQEALIRPLGLPVQDSPLLRETPVRDDLVEKGPAGLEPRATATPPVGNSAGVWGGARTALAVTLGLTSLALILFAGLQPAVANGVAGWWLQRHRQPPKFIQQWADYTRQHPLGGAAVPNSFWHRLLATVKCRLDAVRQLPPLPVQLEQWMRRGGLTPPMFLLRWSYHAALPPVWRAYLEINHALRRLGVRPKLDDTPAERAAQLAQLLPQAAAPIDQLVAEYQTAAYSLHPADIEIAQVASAQIRKVSYLTLFERWVERLRAPWGLNVPD